MTADYKSIKSVAIPDEIVRRIKEMITTGKLSPGDKLPSERALAGLLGVGRSSLREALKTLSILGFVQIRERRGVYVSNLGAVVVPDPFTQIMEGDRNRVRDLYELRADLEMATAFMAAKNRTAEDLAALEKYIRLWETQIEEPKMEIAADIGFHLTISRAAGNILRTHVLENLFDRYSHYIDQARLPLLKEKDHNKTIFGHHLEILKMIEERQPVEARKAMRNHLSFVLNQYEQSIPS